MLIFTDTTIASLLQITEHLRQHKLYGRMLHPPEPDGEMRPSHQTPLVVDTHIFFNDDNPDELWLNAVEELRPLKEVVLAVGLVPPWEAKRAKKTLKWIAEQAEFSQNKRPSSGFCAAWYYPVSNRFVKELIRQARGPVQAIPGPCYEKMAHPAWRTGHHREIEAIERAVLCHQLDGKAISPGLGELLVSLAKSKKGGT